MKNIDYSIRGLREDEVKVLDEFIYQAIFIPEGVKAPSRDIINQPDLHVYVKDFGTQKGDHCLVAETDGKIVGAAWSRIMNDYGHIDDDTPSLAISLLPEYRGNGIGTKLMTGLLEVLKKNGYKRTSLAVQKANYASKMYTDLGFRILRENEEEYIMVYEL